MKFDKYEMKDLYRILENNTAIENLIADEFQSGRAFIDFEIDGKEYQIVKGLSGAWFYKPFIENAEQCFNNLINSWSYKNNAAGININPGLLILQIQSTVSNYRPFDIQIIGYETVSVNDIYKLVFQINDVQYAGTYQFIGNDRLIALDGDDYCLYRFNLVDVNYVLNELSKKLRESLKDNLMLGIERFKAVIN
ncbi:hypothetical protein [Brucella gallinifaecis]|uniref:hypothetical protein n=1 Tax=Brucella gallinifaecis TaxID=215590 RepID=UPI00235EA9A1|nr:hypothetical protein [Brucella gallinifaecis]